MRFPHPALLILSTIIALPLGALAATPKGQGADTVHVHLTQEPATLNPYADPIPGTLTVCSAVFDTLVDITDKWELQPELAQRLPVPGNGVSRDGLTYRFALRPRVKWHDGAALTPADVVFTLEEFVLPRARSGGVALKGFDRVQDVTALEGNQVTFRLKEPWPGFLEALAGVPILPSHLLGKQSDPNSGPFWRAPVGTGPFSFGEWKSGGIRLWAWESYFKGKPRIGGLSFRTVQDEKAAVTQLEKGELSLMSGVSLRLAKQLKATKGLRVESVPTPFVEYAVYNTQSPELSDKRVRKALSHLFPFDYIRGEVYGGFWKQASALGFATSRAVSARGPLYDPDKARRLLDDAGWHPGPDGVRARSGRKLVLDIVTTVGNKQREQVLGLVRDEARKVGITLNTRAYPSSLFFAEAANGGIVDGGLFDVALFGVATGIDPDMHRLLHSSMTPPGGNSGYYRSQRADSLLEDLRRGTDPKERSEKQSELLEILSEEVPFTPILFWGRIEAYTERLRNFKPAGTPGGLVWNAWEWVYAGEGRGTEVLQ